MSAVRPLTPRRPTCRCGRAASPPPPLLLLLLASIGLERAHAHLPGQNPNGPPESTVPLIQALIDEDLPKFRELLKQHPEQVNGRDVITPLYAAQEYVRSSRSRHDALLKLLRAGASPDLATNDGSTPLMLAAYQGDVRSAQILLDYGADPLRRNMQEHDAVSAAQRGGHSELAE